MFCTATKIRRHFPLAPTCPLLSRQLSSSILSWSSGSPEVWLSHRSDFVLSSAWQGKLRILDSCFKYSLSKLLCISRPASCSTGSSSSSIGKWTYRPTAWWSFLRNNWLSQCHKSIGIVFSKWEPSRQALWWSRLPTFVASSTEEWYSRQRGYHTLVRNHCRFEFNQWSARLSYSEEFKHFLVDSDSATNCRIKALSEAATEDVKMVEGLVPGIDFCNHGRLFFGVLFPDRQLHLSFSSNSQNFHA